jgi:uncharacterized phage-associated protein
MRSVCDSGSGGMTNELRQTAAVGPYDARALANLVLDRGDQLGLGISNLHVNKVLFFVHGRFWAAAQIKLIDQPFEAWRHGPVVQDLYHKFKNFESAPIRDRAMVLDKASRSFVIAHCALAENHRELFSDLLDFYIRIPAGRLYEMSHAPGTPWYRVWNYEGKSNPGMFIPDAFIAEWFVRAASVGEGEV